MAGCDRPELLKGLLPVEQAIDQLLAAAVAITDIETVGLEQALGRVLASDQISSINVPPADNSAMDGYAVLVDDCAEAHSVTMNISQRIPAGVSPKSLLSGTAARIFTGAEVPANADAVVMQEDCEVSSDDADNLTVQLPAAIKNGQNIRRQGQDIAKGSTVLTAGHRLKAQDIGLLASVGVAEVPVYRRLKVAVFSTGDELVEPGQTLPAGHIYNSNRYTLAGQIDGLGFERIDLGIIADSAKATEQALRKAAEIADCVVTTGGVSVGEEDHVKACVEKLGTIDLWKLAIKPGKPFAFGNVLGKPFIGLPGNPAAVFVTFAIVARPFLLRTQGVDEVLPTPIPVIAGFGRDKPAKRQEYLRAKLVLGDDGIARVELAGNQSSGVLSTVSVANGFVVHLLGETIDAGKPVPFIAFSELV